MTYPQDQHDLNDLAAAATSAMEVALAVLLEDELDHAPIRPELAAILTATTTATSAARGQMTTSAGAPQVAETPGAESVTARGRDTSAKNGSGKSVTPPGRTPSIIGPSLGGVQIYTDEHGRTCETYPVEGITLVIDPPPDPPPF